MNANMTPKQIRMEIDAIDRRLAELSAWEASLTETRKRYVLASEAAVVALIDYGKRPGEGRPNDPALEAFDRRMPGLTECRATIARLREQKELLSGCLPTAAAQSATVAELHERANALIARIENLPCAAGRLNELLAEAGALAVTTAESARALWEERLQLLRSADVTDVEIPSIPEVEMPNVPVAAILGTLLQRHFVASEPYPVSPAFWTLRPAN